VWRAVECFSIWVISEALRDHPKSNILQRFHTGVNFCQASPRYPSASHALNVTPESNVTIAIFSANNASQKSVSGVSDFSVFSASLKRSMVANDLTEIGSPFFISASSLSGP